MQSTQRRSLHATYSPSVGERQSAAAACFCRVGTIGDRKSCAARVSHTRHGNEDTHASSQATNEKTAIRHSCGLWLSCPRRSLKRRENRLPPRNLPCLPERTREWLVRRSRLYRLVVAMYDARPWPNRQ